MHVPTASDPPKPRLLAWLLCKAPIYHAHVTWERSRTCICNFVIHISPTVSNTDKTKNCHLELVLRLSSENVSTTSNNISKPKHNPLGTIIVGCNSYISELNRSINTFTAIVDLSRFNNSCLKSPASTLVHLNFQSRALRSFSLNQLRNLSL